jgi:hypothetical protein
MSKYKIKESQPTKIEIELADDDSDEKEQSNRKMSNSNSNNNKQQSNLDVPQWDDMRIFLCGFGDSCTDEMIRLYLLLIANNSLDDKLKIENLCRNNSRVLVKFNRIVNYEDIKHRQQKMPDLCGDPIRLDRVKVPNTVKLSEMPSECNEEVLRLYFTNEKTSNGGDVERIRIFPMENRALVEFKNPATVDRVLGQTHVLFGNLIGVEKYYLQVEDVGFDVDGDIETKTDRKRRKSKGNKKTSITADHQFSTASAQQVTTAIDKSKLILANIQENVNIQQLEFYIKLLTNKADISQISWSYEHKGKLLVEFKHDVDMNRIYHEYNSNSFNNLNGKPVEIETVNITRTLILIIRELATGYHQNKSEGVTSEPDDDNDGVDSAIARIPVTKDLLELYFVNKKRSGGGDIEFIERKSAHYWLVCMKDQRSIKELIARKHHVDYKQIKVFPYYENFGLPYLVHLINSGVYDDDDGKQQATRNDRLAYKLRIRDDRLRYFLKNKRLHEKLNDILSESNAIAKYDPTEGNVLHVEYWGKVGTKIAYLEKIWRIRVRESIEYFLHIYKYDKLGLTRNQWTTILKAMGVPDETTMYKSCQVDAEDGSRIIDNQNMPSGSGNGTNHMDALFGNLVYISVKEVSSTGNVEINTAGPVVEVDKFIARVKDIICKVFYANELEERIVDVRTYLVDCEQLLDKYVQMSEFGDRQGGADGNDRDVEILLASSRAHPTSSDTISVSYSNFRQQRNNDDDAGRIDSGIKCKIMNNYISRLEQDYTEIDLSYRKLIQELRYAFLTRDPVALGTTAFADDDDDHHHHVTGWDDYGELVDDSTNETRLRSDDDELDSIKITLNELGFRINQMRTKFQDYLLTIKQTSDKRKQSTISQTKIASRIQSDDKVSAKTTSKYS